MSNINEIATRSLFKQVIYNEKNNEVKVDEFEKEDRWLGTSNDGSKPMFTNTSNVVPSIPKHIFEKAKEYAPLFSRLQPIFTKENTFKGAKSSYTDSISLTPEMINIKEEDFVFTPFNLVAKRCGLTTTVSQHLDNDSNIAIPYVQEKMYKAMAEKLDRLIIDGGDGELKPTGYLCNIDRKEEQINIPVEFNENHLKKVANKINCNIRKNGIYIFNETVFEEKISDLTTVDERGITLLNGYPVFTTTRGFDDTVASGSKIGVFTNVEETFETIIQTKDVMLRKTENGEILKAIKIEKHLKNGGLEQDLPKVINQDTLNILRGSITFILDLNLDLGIVNEKATMPIVIA